MARPPDTSRVHPRSAHLFHTRGEYANGVRRSGRSQLHLRNGDPALDHAGRGILVTGTLDGGGDSFTVVTDTAGVYSAVGLTAGGWTIKFEDLDNKTLATEWYSVAGGAGLESGADPVIVTDGVATVGIDTQLALGAAVNGTITDTTGAPVPALMSLYTSAGGTLVDTQTADADGSYRFRGLQAGSYFVNAEDPVFGVDEWLGLGAFPGTEVVVVEGQLDGGNGITLTGGRIIGSVTSDGATPLPGIPVTFDALAPRTPARTVSMNHRSWMSAPTPSTSADWTPPAVWGSCQAPP